MGAQSAAAGAGTQRRLLIAHVREDEKVASYIGTRLQEEGYSVLWGRSTADATTFDCVIALWSRLSSDDPQVHAVASAARNLGRLVSIRLDSWPLPPGIQHAQVIDFQTQLLAPGLSQQQAADRNQMLAHLRAAINHVLSTLPSRSDPSGNTGSETGCVILIVIAVIAAVFLYSNRDALPTSTSQAPLRSGAPPQQPRRWVLVADSIRDMTSSPGGNQWSARWEGGNGRNSFQWQALPHFNEGCWHGDAREPYVRLCVTGEVLPGLVNNVAFQWVSNVQGKIHIDTHIQKVETQCGDGVELVILKRNQAVSPVMPIAANDSNGQTYAVEVEVVSGDNVQVVVMARGELSCDLSLVRTRIYLLQ